MPDDSDDARYLVVVNHEEMYSIWPADRTVPTGWTAVGAPATKAECLAYIDEVWAAGRPSSLREQMGHGAAEGASGRGTG